MIDLQLATTRRAHCSNVAHRGATERLLLRLTVGPERSPAAAACRCARAPVTERDLGNGGPSIGGTVVVGSDVVLAMRLVGLKQHDVGFLYGTYRLVDDRDGGAGRGSDHAFFKPICQAFPLL
jgi:hypothetical protein